MARRTKILIICNDIDKQTNEYLEWIEILEEHLGKQSKGFLEEKRIETPYVIMDFVFQKPIYTSGYKVVLDLNTELNAEERNENLLKLAIGEKVL